MAYSGQTPIPVFDARGKPFDVRAAIQNTVECPVKFLSRAPPEMVVDNYCFVVDGDAVPLESLSSGEWWRNTSVTTRFYSVQHNDMRSFRQVSRPMLELSF